MKHPSFKQNPPQAQHDWSKGTYNCTGCGAELFRAPYHWVAGVRWPSTRTALAGHVRQIQAELNGRVYNFFTCAHCGQRLGFITTKGKLCGEGAGDSSHRFCSMSPFIVFHETVPVL